MFQESNIAETFKIKKTQRDKTITAYALSLKEPEINQFREQLFLHCGMSLSIFKLLTQTAFWFMLFNWIECNKYSITIGPEKRKLLAQYYSRSNDPDSTFTFLKTIPNLGTIKSIVLFLIILHIILMLIKKRTKYILK